jgi:hypothetical protein
MLGLALILIGVPGFVVVALLWWMVGGSVPSEPSGTRAPALRSTSQAESGADAQAKASEVVAKIRTSDMGNKDLVKSLRGLALDGGTTAIEALMLLAAEPGYEVPTLEALGAVRSPEARDGVGKFLKERFGSRNPHAAGAAVRSYARIFGDAAVPEVAEYIRLRWQMRDGYELQAASAGAVALGQLNTPASTAALAAELARAFEPGWLPDYGSAVVAALAKSKEPAAREALLNYAETLQARMPGPDNPPGRVYYEEKIAEARTAALGRDANAHPDTTR